VVLVECGMSYCIVMAEMYCGASGMWCIVLYCIVTEEMYCGATYCIMMAEM
jgi:hypothetical protein